MRKPRIAVPIGDSAGIGPEIVAKAMSSNPTTDASSGTALPFLLKAFIAPKATGSFIATTAARPFICINCSARCSPPENSVIVSTFSSFRSAINKCSGGKTAL